MVVELPTLVPEDDERLDLPNRGQLDGDATLALPKDCLGRIGAVERSLSAFESEHVSTPFADLCHYEYCNARGTPSTIPLLGIRADNPHVPQKSRSLRGTHLVH